MAPQSGPARTDLDEILHNTFTTEFRKGYITVDGYCFPENYKKFAGAIENMEVKDDDIWVCSFPKTGTTWTQEMVWCIANELDFERGKEILPERFPFLEVSPLFDFTTTLQRNPDLDLPAHFIDSVKFVEKLPSPRFIKSHLPFNVLPRQLRTGEKKPKMIYVTRNVKDTCVSYYHHCKLLEGYRGTFEEFCELFLGSKLPYAPFWDHILGYFEKKDERNILFLKYEDMKADLPNVIKKVAAYLGKRMSDDEVNILKEHLSFANMKVNPAVNYEDVIEMNKKFNLVKEPEGKFIRSGSVDQWKEKMTSALIDRFNKSSDDNLKGIAL